MYSHNIIKLFKLNFLRYRMNYNRTIEELKENAVFWWPEDLRGSQKSISIIPKLIESQDKFIAILTLFNSSKPDDLIKLIESSNIPFNLFLKHLCVILDYGGEPIQRLNSSFKDIFEWNKESNSYQMTYTFDKLQQTYTFKSLPLKGLNNSKLLIDGPGLDIKAKYSCLYEDMFMILMFAAFSTSSEHAALHKCDMAERCGNKDELERYIKERYIYVSRITGGALANTLGQLLQIYVVDYISKRLNESFSIKSNGKIELIDFDNKKINYPFDVVVEKESKKVGIEISFQVTTNSTIERKGSLAHDRQILMHKNGYNIAYVIDGAGNFQRVSAVSSICSNSDCTVAFSDCELDVLCDWLREVLND